ncbi:catalase [Streptomyces sp. NPDC056519]|uniref:catalase n=1 Tax=Streptomyces sp. NPDC056519 TaxID=3345849 RepID=UPI003695C1D6
MDFPGEFVRYADIATGRDAAAGADFDGDAAGAPHVGRVPSSRARPYGLLRGELRVLPATDRRYFQGLYAAPARYPALIRYSNGLGHWPSDVGLGSASAMAMKLLDVPVETFEGRRTAGTMDYVLVNSPVSFAAAARDGLTVARLLSDLPEATASVDGRARWLHAFVSRNGKLGPEHWLWDELFALLAQISSPLPCLLHTAFWSAGALRHGDHVAKVRVVPAPDTGAEPDRRVDPLSSAQPVRDELVRDAGAADHFFDVQVQLCVDPGSMPPDNAAVLWPEWLSPFVTVARLVVPAQDISAPENPECADELSFTPWRAPASHQPVGGVQAVRHRLNERPAPLRHLRGRQHRGDGEARPGPGSRAVDRAREPFRAQGRAERGGAS